MKTIIHRSAERGHADYGWLNTWYSFSFAGWFDAQKVHFGMLRVLNDDTIAPGQGFGMHPHDNMEIITIPLKGALEHKDSMGNTGQIKYGEIQVMSAGTGITHSEYNPSGKEETKLFQVWVFPKLKNIEPRYDQKAFSLSDRKNKFQILVSPERNTDTLWINQDAWFSLGNFEKGIRANYKLHHRNNGVYAMSVEGMISVAGETLLKRDAIAISEAEDINFEAAENSEVLLIEVPMH